MNSCIITLITLFNMASKMLSLAILNKLKGRFLMSRKNSILFKIRQPLLNDLCYVELSLAFHYPRYQAEKSRAQVAFGLLVNKSR